MLVVWRPDFKRYTAYVTQEVPTSEPSTGGIMNLDLPKVAAQGLGLALAAWQQDVYVSIGDMLVGVVSNSSAQVPPLLNSH